MSIDTLQPSSRRLVRLAEALGTPNGNPEFRCLVKSSPGTRKPSAVERLEADKVKYVKSQQVALKRQQPVTCPSNKSQSGPGAHHLTRKVLSQPTKSETPPLDLEHLCKLIDGVSDTITTVVSVQPSITGKVQKNTDPCKLFSQTPNAVEEPSVGSSSQEKAVVEASGANGCPIMTIRRVDVMPHIPQMRMADRPQLQSRPLGQLATPQVPMQLLHLLRPYIKQNQNPIPFKQLHNFTHAPRGPIKPPNSLAQTISCSKSPSSPFNSLPVPIKPNPEPATCTSSTKHTPTSVPPFLIKNDFQSPPSPAITHRSSTSSRKRPSLTRSKSDVSDCFSRAGAELERFFNYCGLDPSDLEELARPGSDIVSVSRLRSASAPASERTTEGEDDEEEAAAKDEHAGYGISVIERNARVIKWLYGMRQAKESPKVANM